MPSSPLTALLMLSAKYCPCQHRHHVQSLGAAYLEVAVVQAGHGDSAVPREVDVRVLGKRIDLLAGHCKGSDRPRRIYQTPKYVLPVNENMPASGSARILFI